MDVALEAKRGWFMLVLNRRQREINRISFGLLTSIAGAASARYGAGTGSHHELARAEVERNAVEVERVSLEGQRISMVAMLNALRNLPADTAIADPPLTIFSRASQHSRTSIGSRDRRAAGGVGKRALRQLPLRQTS